MLVKFIVCVVAGLGAGIGTGLAGLSAAVRYLHAPASVGSISDFEAMLKLTRLFLADQAAQLTL